MRTKDLSASAYDVQGGLALDMVTRGPAKIDTKRMSASCVFSTPSIDRVGDRITMAGIQTDNHRRNPVVSWNHFKELSLPIGRAMDDYGNYTVVITENEATQTTYFSQKVHEAAQIFWLIEEKIIAANSIGFDPIKSSPLYLGSRRAGLDLREVDLLEIAWVAVGCNQDAVRSALSRERICGKALADPIRKSLEPYASARPIWSKGVTLPAERYGVMADIVGGLLIARPTIPLKKLMRQLAPMDAPALRKFAIVHHLKCDPRHKAKIETAVKAWSESDHPRGQPGNAGQFGSGGGGSSSGGEGKPSSDKPTGDKPTDKPSDGRKEKIAAYAEQLKQQHGDAALSKVKEAIEKLKASDDPAAAGKISALQEAADHLGKESPTEAPPASVAPTSEHAPTPTKRDKNQETRDAEDEAVTAARDGADEKLSTKREKEDAKFDAEEEKMDARHEAEKEKHEAKGDKLSEKRDKATDKRDADDERIQDRRDKEDEKIIAARDKEDAKIEAAREKEDAQRQKERDKVRDQLEAARDEHEDGEKYDAADALCDEHDTKCEEEDEAISDARSEEDTELQERRDTEDAELEAARDTEDEALQEARDAEDAEFDDQEEALGEEASEIEERHEQEQAEFQERKQEVEDARSEEDAERQERRDAEDAELQEARDAEDAEFDDQESQHEQEATDFAFKLDAMEDTDEAESAAAEFNAAAAAAGERYRVAYDEDSGEWQLDDMDNVNYAAHLAASFRASQLHAEQLRAAQSDQKSFDENKHPRGQPGNAGQFGSGGSSGGGADKPSSGGSGSKPALNVGRRARAAGRLATREGKKAVGFFVAAAKTAGHYEHVATEWIGKQVQRLPKPLRLPVVGVYKVSMSTYDAAQSAVAAVAKERGNTPEQVERISKVCSVLNVIGAKAIPLTLEIAGAHGAGPWLSGFVPLGSMGYLAYSTARNPMATFRAAKKGVAAAAGKLRSKLQSDKKAWTKRFGVNESGLAEMLDQIKSASDPDQWMATLFAAIDATNGNFPVAIKLTRMALSEK